MDQKYLLSPAAGVLGHIPELEDLYDVLYAELQSKYAGYTTKKEDELPENFLRYLQGNVRRFYMPENRTIQSEADPNQPLSALQETWEADVKWISETLNLFLTNRPKSKATHYAGGYLI
jgi:hypothetical protein